MTYLRPQQEAPIRILYVGSMEEGGTCGQRLRALADLGHTVVCVDTQAHSVRATWAQRISHRVFRMGLDRLGRIPDLSDANVRIRAMADSATFAVVWIDKGLAIEGDTIRYFRRRNPHCVVVGYSGDDMGSRHCQSRQFLEHLPLYDVFFTTKSYNVAELKAMGCARVQFIGNAYDPHVHRPVSLTRAERESLGGPLGFIGTREAERLRCLQRLAKDGIPVRVWGEGWKASARSHPNLVLEERLLWGDLYAKAIAAFDINLCFLRRLNRDRQTTRSVEIPACGKFMLAERTDEHLEMFEEGIEAEFFESYEELLDKIAFYLCRPELRDQIGAAARVRCEKSGYSNHDRLRSGLKIVGSIHGTRSLSREC